MFINQPAVEQNKMKKIPQNVVFSQFFIDKNNLLSEVIVDNNVFLHESVFFYYCINFIGSRGETMSTTCFCDLRITP